MANLEAVPTGRWAWVRGTASCWLQLVKVSNPHLGSQLHPSGPHRGPDSPVSSYPQQGFKSSSLSLSSVLHSSPSTSRSPFTLWRNIRSHRPSLPQFLSLTCLAPPVTAEEMLAIVSTLGSRYKDIQLNVAFILEAQAEGGLQG